MRSHDVYTRVIQAGALILGLSASCSTKAEEPTQEFFADMRKMAEESRKLSVIAMESDRSVAAVRADLAGPWTSVIISLRRDHSLQGTVYAGFCLTREGDTASVAPWMESEGRVRVGSSHPLAKPEVEKLLSEATLFYLASTLTVAPVEKAGPRPDNPDKVVEWNLRYRSAGGIQHNRLAETVDYGMDIRVTTSDEMKQHSNMWGNHCPVEFQKWAAAFGNPPSP